MIEPIDENDQDTVETGLVTMQKDSAIISVRIDQIELWEKRGYKVIE
jgi:hypothetical protein